MNINSLKLKTEVIQKGWGNEIIFINTSKYCGKLLNLNKGKKFSMHYHMVKDETWFVVKGNLLFRWIDTTNGKTYCESLGQGDVVRNYPAFPHQLEALEDSTIFEVSTQHFEHDSYRVAPGDSQS